MYDVIDEVVEFGDDDFGYDDYGPWPGAAYSPYAYRYHDESEWSDSSGSDYTDDSYDGWSLA